MDSQNIYIGSETIENFIYIQIKDEGIGMDQEQLNSLWSPQTKSTLGTKKETGTGLGLFFCRDLVKKGGGDLSVKSEVNKGTTVTFSIPFYIEIPEQNNKREESAYMVS